MNRGIKRHKREAEKKREKSQRALLLADGEKCCKLTDMFLKSSAASASTSANTASINVSDTVEPTHQGERQDREEYEQEEDEEGDLDNCDSKTCFNYGATGSDDSLTCFYCGCASFWFSCLELGSLRSPSLGPSAVRVLYVCQMPGPVWFPVRHCSRLLTSDHNPTVFIQITTPNRIFEKLWHTSRGKLALQIATR